MGKGGAGLEGEIVKNTNFKGAIKLSEKSRPSALKKIEQPKFEQEVILRQSPFFSRAIIWTIVSLGTFGFAWASVAKIEQVVRAQGKLEPTAAVKSIQAPLLGVVKDVLVENGQEVKKDQVLLTFDSKASEAQLKSLEDVRKTIKQESLFYRALMSQPLDRSQIEKAIVQLKLPSEIAALARSRVALVEENQLYKMQLGAPRGGVNLTPEQSARLAASRAELNSRAAAARLAMEQVEKQLQQIVVQLADAKAQLVTQQMVLEDIKLRNELNVREIEKSLEIEKNVLRDVEPLLDEGALSKLQVEKQRQAVNDRYSNLITQKANGVIEYNRQAEMVKTTRAKIDQLQEEETRLKLNVVQAREQLMNTTALTAKTILDAIGQNDKAIAAIDSQLTKNVIENDKLVAQTESQIATAQQNLKYQEIRSPIDGVVFDLKASPGLVPTSEVGLSSPVVVKVVPKDNLTARVFITNKDIGFVRVGMKTDIRIDTFPFSQFGDVEGTVESIGSDALPPDAIYNFYRFPAEIKMDSQVLEYQGKKIPLQSGMSVSVNIRIRENRTVMDLIWESLTRTSESLKEVK
jgi:HlyD family secretion protein